MSDQMPPPPPPQGPTPPPPPPPPPGGYGGAPYPGQAGASNSKATLSLILSILGLCCGLSAVAGIILGVLSIKEIDQTGEGGRGIAQAGIIVGAVALVLNFIGVLTYAGNGGY